MPPELPEAHTELDRAVDRCHRSEPFRSDRERVELRRARNGWSTALAEVVTWVLVRVLQLAGGRESDTTSGDVTRINPMNLEVQSAPCAVRNGETP